MNDISHIFKSIKLDKYKQDTTCLYDPIRHLLVQKTPEEEVRQKTIKFLQDGLGVPIDRVLVEESMSHVKKGARGRADIVVYRDDERKDALMVVECKAPHIDVYCDDVLEQAERYRKIVKADYVMLINGDQVAIYQSKKEKYFEVENIPTYQDLLDDNLAFVEKRIINPYTYEQIMLKELQEKFYDCGYFGDDTPENKKGFYLNLLNLILLKEDTDKFILEKIGVIKDCFRGMTKFGNSGGGSYQVWSRLFIAKDYKCRDQVLGISICGTAHTENDEHWGTRLGNTQLNVSITNKENRHHSLQLNLDKFSNYNPQTNKIVITHNGALSYGRGGSIKQDIVRAYIRKKAPELVCNNYIYIGELDNSQLLEWNQESVQSFVRNLLKYAILRDEIRAKYKK
ncbi:type I restriction enzyme HsdR N-terminal domain-containing protein [Veillonella sp.]